MLIIQLNALLEFQVESTGAIGRGEDRRGMARHQDVRRCNEETHTYIYIYIYNTYIYIIYTQQILYSYR